MQADIRMGDTVKVNNEALAKAQAKKVSELAKTRAEKDYEITVEEGELTEVEKELFEEVEEEEISEISLKPEKEDEEKDNEKEKEVKK